MLNINNKEARDLVKDEVVPHIKDRSKTLQLGSVLKGEDPDTVLHIAIYDVINRLRGKPREVKMKIVCFKAMFACGGSRHARPDDTVQMVRADRIKAPVQNGPVTNEQLKRALTRALQDLTATIQQM